MSRYRNGIEEEMFKFLIRTRARREGRVNNMKCEQGFEEGKIIHKVSNKEGLFREIKEYLQ